VIPFRRHQPVQFASEPPALGVAAALADIESRMKSAIESIVADAYITDQLRLRSEQVENPFDAVYLSRLTPDPIGPQDIQHLMAYAHVEDLSDSIGFNDGLDD
jgi:hypothetical protein